MNVKLGFAKFRSKINRTYGQMSRRSEWIKLTNFVLTSFVFVFILLWHWRQFHGHAGWEDISWFAYLTNLCTVMFAFYYLCWFLGRYFNLPIFQKIHDSVHFKFIIIEGVFLLWWGYAMISFVPIAIERLQEESFRAFVWWVVPTTLKHFLNPIIIWIDFRTENHWKEAKKKNVYSTLWWLVAYEVGSLVAVSYGNPAPYAFVDYINNPFAVTTVFIIAIPVFWGVSNFLIYSYNKTISRDT